MQLDQATIQAICAIAQGAGSLILRFDRSPGTIQKNTKPDGSVVTAADLAAHDYVEQALKQLQFPRARIVSEEGLSAQSILEKGAMYWLIDPLDGTRGYVQGWDDFTVNIALIENGYPILGVIVHPVSGQCFWAAAGQGAYSQFYPSPKSTKPISTLPQGEGGDTQEHTRFGQGIKLQNTVLQGEGASIQGNTLPLREGRTERSAVRGGVGTPWRILTGCFQNQAVWAERLEALGPLTFSGQNSSMKFCTLAQGQADLYPRYTGIAAWDTAAGQCILEEAGGAVVDFTGARVCYTGPAQTPGFRDQAGFLAFANRNHIKDCLSLLTLRSHLS